MSEFEPGKYRIYYAHIGGPYVDDTNSSRFSFVVEANTLEELQSHYYEKGIFIGAEKI